MQFFGNELNIIMDSPRVFLVVDQTNSRAIKQSKKFKKYVKSDPNLIVVCGGDGFMLDSIRRYQHMQLPFCGDNAGHVGFLLNNPKASSKGIPRKLKIYTLPIFNVEMIFVNGKVKRTVAFNDVWVERLKDPRKKKSQTASIEIKVNGRVRLKRLVADGALIATPTGSTGYAKSMGASPVPLDAQVIVLAGSNTLSPDSFRPCNLPIWSTVEFRVLDPVKRPGIGVVDGIQVGRVQSVKASISKTASFQLVSIGRNSLPEKLLGTQFPKQ